MSNALYMVRKDWVILFFNGNMEKAILKIYFDAINVKNAQEGEVKRLSVNDFSTIHCNNPHDTTLPDALKLAKKLGEAHIPQDIVIIGIVLKENPYIFGEKLSNKIAAAIPKAVEMTLNEINVKGKISS